MVSIGGLRRAKRNGRVPRDSGIRIISRQIRAFIMQLFRPFRARYVRGWQITQGGARRLRRLALPWANLFCPFGAGRFLDAGRFLRGKKAASAPGPRDAIVLNPIRGKYKIAQGREPNEWLLLTSLPITNTVEVLDVIRTYSQRWTIEIFFAC